MTTRNILWMILLTLSLPALPADSGEFSTDVSVDTAKPIGAVNTLILGSNLQWVDRGDEMFEPGGMRIAPAMLEHAQALGVTLLRYPGGSLSDLYHWRDGMGGQEKRGENEHFYSGRKQKVEVGTQEFLELCESLGALPLITVNVGSGTAEEAAEWVRMVNVTGLTSRLSGKRLPRVRYWEIGNEPYLKDDKQKKIWMTPETYAARAAEFIVAMRKVDPAIEVGIPLRSDKIGGRPATPLPGFNETVLMSLKPRFDFVALHDAYLPTATDGKYSDEDLYWASVAATEVVQADFLETQGQLDRLQPGRPIRLAVTEHSAMFTSGRDSDAYIDSPAGALYEADLLRLFAYTPNVAFANFWSLSGNWYFGSIGRDSTPRCSYQVLQAYHRVLRGTLLAVSVKTSAVNTPTVGYVPAMRGVPLVRALATLDDNKVRLMIINRDPDHPSQARITFTDARSWTAAKLSTWQARSRFDTRSAPPRFLITTQDLGAGKDVLSVHIPATSFAVVELEPVSARDAVRQRPAQ